ncbi:MAG: restriction endonuclease subunit S [Verrucomicrobiales bacterium]|nr:restriction endonuclease subunit S [Verrucomicrobiales bacterium]
MSDGIRKSNDELPDGWARAPFSSVTVDPIQRVPDEKEKITYIDIGSVDRDTKTVVEPQSILGKDAPSRARKVIQTGDVLVSTVRPNLNAVALVESQYDGQFASTGFDVLRSPVMDSRWLFYSVRTPEFLDRMSELVQGALYPAVRSKDIRSFVIPIAPLAEQKRIADKLEAVLGRVDACRTRLDRVPALLKRFRQSVLAAATSGMLTEEWRGENGVDDEWEEAELGSLIFDGPKNGLYKSSTCYGQGTRILRIDNFYSGYINSWEGLKRLTVSIDELNDFGLEVGDIVVNRVNSMSHLGKSALVRELPEPCVFESNMMRIRLDVARLTPDFCILVLTSPGGIDQLQQNAKQAVNQASINQTDVKSVIVSLPTLSEQIEIVRRVEALFALADRIEARLATAQKTVERLTPATLAKAFRGELVLQDPDDEPAAVLLERLQSESAAKPAKAIRNTRK